MRDAELRVDLDLSTDQVAAIADKASDRVRAAIWIALQTRVLARRSAGAAAGNDRRRHHHLPAGNTKTLRTRTVPIVPALRPWLAAVPLRMNFEGLKSGFRRAREAAGMAHVHFHDLRHSCATILLSLGTPLDVVRDTLGHTTIRTTERYAHALVDRQRTTLEGLGTLTKKHQPRAPATRRAA